MDTMKTKHKTKLVVKGWRAGSAKNAMKKAWEKKKETFCKCCDTSLKGISPIKPFSKIYDRMCHARDGDLCERA